MRISLLINIVPVPVPTSRVCSRPCPAAEEAHHNVAGLGDNAVHAKYVELVRRQPCFSARPALASPHLVPPPRTSSQSSSGKSATTQRRSKSLSKTRMLVRSAALVFPQNTRRLSSRSRSQGPTHQGEPDQDQDGEPRSRAAEGDTAHLRIFAPF